MPLPALARSPIRDSTKPAKHNAFAQLTRVFGIALLRPVQACQRLAAALAAREELRKEGLGFRGHQTRVQVIAT